MGQAELDCQIPVCSQAFNGIARLRIDVLGCEEGGVAALGDTPLAALTRMDVTSWYMNLSVTLAKEADERRARGYKGNTDGRGTLHSAYQVLCSILADAVDHELLDVSPAKVKGALQYETLHEPVVLTPEQMWQLTDLLPDYLRAFVPLLATTGLRKGEMQALMRGHLVLDDPRPARRPSSCITQRAAYSLAFGGSMRRYGRDGLVSSARRGFCEQRAWSAAARLGTPTDRARGAPGGAGRHGLARPAGRQSVGRDAAA
ncbi:hypothetical protein ACFT2C_11955 [Promicromonospora sp. NPDC057138]|uniref:hypothetical protein n=1 Tax=Promicromonospora sp. NPDC057138 TaxID=3346031 RepID=UPI003634D23E